MDSAKNDYHFVHAAFEWLRKFGYFNNKTGVYIFSDNGGKHFKNKTTFAYVESLAVQLVLWFRWLIYAPHHGWNLCDGRGGLLSQKSEKAALDENKPDTAEKMQKMIESSNLTNAYPVVLKVSIYTHMR